MLPGRSILQSPNSKEDNVYNRIYGQSSGTLAPTITSNNATLNSSNHQILGNSSDPRNDDEPSFFDDEDEREVFEIYAPSGKVC